MNAFFNENEPYAAQWLRNLVQAGHIAKGRVDDRSIKEVQPEDIKECQAHFFAGIGVWSYALRLAGWPDDRPVWTGSCPCQPFSVAGKGGGTSDERHLWPEWFRLIRECRPPVIFGEQVAGRAGLDWFDAVASDMEGIGYAVAAARLCSAGESAIHKRDRLYWAAVAPNACGVRRARPRTPGIADSDGQRRTCGQEDLQHLADHPFSGHAGYPQPLLRKGDDGYSESVGRNRAYGNAIDPRVAARFVKAVMGSVEEA